MSGDLTSNSMLACPLCGCDDLETSPWPANRERTEWVSRCGNPDCGCEVRGATSEEVAAKWNRRATVKPSARLLIECAEAMEENCEHEGKLSTFVDLARRCRAAVTKSATPSIDEQLAWDQRTYGTSYQRIDFDGTRTRIDPATVMIAPQPADETGDGPNAAL